MNILVKAKGLFPTYFPAIINYSSDAHVLMHIFSNIFKVSLSQPLIPYFTV